MESRLAIILLLAQQIVSVPVSDDYELNNEIEESIAPEPLYDSASKYHIFTTRVTWAEATKQCESKGYQLVNIMSKEANDNVINAIKAAKQGEIGFWTSGNRMNTDGTYFWGNGQPVVYTNWEHGIPDNLHANIGREEECIEIKGYNILKWNDHLCSFRLYYICEVISEQNDGWIDVNSLRTWSFISIFCFILISFLSFLLFYVVLSVIYAPLGTKFSFSMARS